MIFHCFSCNNLVKPIEWDGKTIESRSPFRSNLIELHLISGKLKLKNNETKYILKSIEGLIGPELTYRKKKCL